MSVVTLAEIKNFLRVDFSDDDALISDMVNSAEKMCQDTLRATFSEFSDVSVIKSAVFYVVAYLYEHREDSDMEKLSKMLRYILAPLRKMVF